LHYLWVRSTTKTLFKGNVVFENCIRRALALFVALLLTGLSAFAQDRPLAPSEAMALGMNYVLIPMAKDLRRRCTCVSAAFAESRVPYIQNASGPGAPLRHPEPERAIRQELDRYWRDLVTVGTPAFRPDAGSNDRLSAAALMITGRGIRTLRGRDAVRTGVQLYKLAADAGHQDAQADLGYLSMIGMGVPRSDDEAAYWYSRAAENGSHLAKLALGAMYATGRGMPQSDAGAAHWFAQAHNSRFVADAYACGYGVELDLATARKMYEELAERGDPDAQFQLGNMFAEACGAPLDDTKAAKWYRAAAEQGHPDAQIALSVMTRQGLGVPQSAYSAYEWAQLAVLRLERDDEALNHALVARAAAGLMATPEERQHATAFARALIQASSKDVAGR
jgi:TPR repeat protein